MSKHDFNPVEVPVSTVEAEKTNDAMQTIEPQPLNENGNDARVATLELKFDFLLAYIGILHKALQVYYRDLPSPPEFVFLPSVEE